MLTVENLHQAYGGSHILRGLSFELKQGEVTTLLGRNGVGKTTLLKSLMGLVKTKSGSMTFDGKDITHLPPHERVKAGIGYVPQGREIFPRLTVEEYQWQPNTVPGQVLDDAAAAGVSAGNSAPSSARPGGRNGRESVRTGVFSALMRRRHMRRMLLLDHNSEGEEELITPSSIDRPFC